MDVNRALLQIPSPASASSSEGAASRSQAGKDPSIGGTKKSFTSVLRTVHQGDHKGRPKQSDDADFKQVAKSGAETEQGKGAEPGKGAGHNAPRPGKIEGRSLDAETDRLSQNQTDQSDETEGRSRDGGAPEANVPTELVRVLGQVMPSQGAPATPSVLLTDDPGQGAIGDALPGSSQDNGITGISTIPVLVTAEPGESVTATTEETDQAPAPPQGAIVPLAQQSQAVVAAQPMQETNESLSGQPLDPMAEAGIKAVDQQVGEQRETPAQGDHSEKQTVAVQPTTPGGEQASPVSQELSRLDAAGPHLDRVVERSVGQKKVEGAVQPHAEPGPPFLPHDGDERTDKPVAMAPYEPQAFSGSGQPSNMLWPNQGDRQPAPHEILWPPHELIAPSQPDLSGDHSAQAATVGNAFSAQARPVDSHPAAPAGAASSVSPAHEIEPFMPTMSRSVVFEIAERDLGRINIRVAMTNELVHAHLSSDRSDVGQLLFSGQDRLQSALQSNGLELGQFRVDIDRQSAGRSFQQGPPQDQTRVWQPASNGAPHEAGFFERHDAAGLSYAGRLNVVA